MLINDFYSLEEIKTEDGETIARIELNPSHDIFKGHFPQHPVVPGVTMIQMVKEILGLVLDRKLQLSKASNVKFKNVLSPKDQTIAFLSLQPSSLEDKDGWRVKAKLFHKDTIFFIFTGEFIERLES